MTPPTTAPVLLPEGTETRCAKEEESEAKGERRRKARLAGSVCKSGGYISHLDYFYHFQKLAQPLEGQVAHDAFHKSKVLTNSGQHVQYN